jgi:hypothetical protein
MALCTALTIACGNNRTAQNNNNTGANAPAAAALADNAKDRPAPVDVQGCLTASGDRFVLTTLKSEAAPTTETYQLISAGTADLAKYVGQQVRVTGEADPARVADVRELTPAAPASQSVGTSGNTAAGDANGPKVRTEENTHFEVRQLRVSSVTGAGGSCPATQNQGR